MSKRRKKYQLNITKPCKSHVNCRADRGARQFTEAEVSDHTDVGLLRDQLDDVNEISEESVEPVLGRVRRQSQWTLLDPRTGRPVG